MNRRLLLCSLAASACLPKKTPPPILAPVETPPAADPSQQARLGWRWVPGMALTYRTEVERQQGDLEIRTADEWRYIALDLDANGVTHLEGQLLARGLIARRDGRRVDDPVLDAAQSRPQTEEQVQLAMRLTGRIVSCSQDDPAAALPHRMLGFHLPTHVIAAQESWSDPPFMMPFSRLVGATLPLDTKALTTIARLEAQRSGGWEVELQHTGTLRSGERSPTVHVIGRSVWHTDPGLLYTRDLTARLDPDREGVGVLRVTTTLVREETPRR